MNSEEQRPSRQLKRNSVAREVPPIWRLVAQSSSDIVTFNKCGSAPALYLIHPISGDVTAYSVLAGSLGPEQRLYGIHVRKDNMTADFAASVVNIARHHVKTLIDFQPEGPLVLGGWSAGAIIALEMAQQLLTLGRDVPLLIALDGAPCNSGAGLSSWNPLYCWKLICNIPDWLKCERRQVRSLHQLIVNFRNYAAFRVQRSFAFKNEQTLHGEAIQSFLAKSGWPSAQMPFVRTLHNALQAYIPSFYKGRVLVFEAKSQPLTHLLQIGAVWKKMASFCEIVVLEGHHSCIYQEPALGMLTTHLLMRLAELRQPQKFVRPGFETAVSSPY